MSSQFWWYLARSSGLVAWGLLAGAMLWGLALSTRVFGRHPRPAWLLDLHRFLGAASLVFIGLHMTSIAFDTYVHFGPLQLLVPLTGAWHPVAVAWGIIALYLLVAVEVTSLVRARLPKFVWRGTHYLTFPLFAMVTIHALSAGTDRHTAVMRAGIIAIAVAVTILSLVRVSLAEHHDMMVSPPPTPSAHDGSARAR